MAGLISDQLINNLRVVAYKQLVTPVTVHRTTREEGPYGTQETDVVAFTTMTWFKPDFKGDLSVQPGGQVGQGSAAEFRFRWGTDIRIGDRLEVEGQSNHIVQDVNDGATISLYLKARTNRLE